MATFTVKHIAKIISAEIIGYPTENLIDIFLIDSRKLTFAERTIFIAIKTEKRNGHHYIEDLYKRGVRHFIVTESPEKLFDDAIYFLVKDAIASLQALAAFHRKKFEYPVVGITGSNGKTIVKEWSYHLFNEKFNIARSPRSFNSQIGVPLSVLQMSEQHDLGIFEAGISTKGEMALLENIISPDIVVFTNLGSAHDEGFADRDEKLKEKLKLCQHAGTIIYCKDHTLIDYHVYDQFSGKSKIVTWGSSTSSTIVIQSLEKISNGIQLKLNIGNKSYNFTLPYCDHAAIENAMHAFALAYSLNCHEEILDRFFTLPPLSMRLEMKEGINDCMLINDSYNADLNGLQTAVEFMFQQSTTKKKVLFMSDISGLSGNQDLAYKDIAEMLRQFDIYKVIGVGTACVKYKQHFIDIGLSFESFASVDDLLQSIHTSSFRECFILLKGARSFKFERINQLFEKKLHQTRLEVELGAIAHNIRVYRKILSPETRIMAMVKAFSYGAGSYEIARVLQLQGIDYLAVAYTDEAVELRKAGIDLPIMVMNTEVQSFPSLVEYGIEPEIYSFEMLESFSFFLKKEGIEYFPIHIKVDTGMHRLGFDVRMGEELVNKLKGDYSFRVKSVFTHLVASEDPLHDGFTQNQIQKFDDFCEEIRIGIGYPFMRHAANTAAISRYKNLSYEMVRLGIGMYGIDTGFGDISLMEAATLKTTISQIKHVSKGESVGYGRKSILSRDAIIATVRIGYADGFPRRLGNGQATMMIRGFFVKTIGNVCMDMTMLDVTDHPEIDLQDEVIVFGKPHSVVDLARQADTIPYEIMTGISQRVPRIYLGE